MLSHGRKGIVPPCLPCSDRVLLLHGIPTSPCPPCIPIFKADELSWPAKVRDDGNDWIAGARCQMHSSRRRRSWPADPEGIEVAAFVANKKAEAYRDVLHNGDVLITGDTVVVLNGKVLENRRTRRKPARCFGRWWRNPHGCLCRGRHHP